MKTNSSTKKNMKKVVSGTVGAKSQSLGTLVIYNSYALIPRSSFIKHAFSPLHHFPNPIVVPSSFPLLPPLFSPNSNPFSPPSLHLVEGHGVGGWQGPSPREDLLVDPRHSRLPQAWLSLFP